MDVRRGGAFAEARLLDHIKPIVVFVMNCA